MVEASGVLRSSPRTALTISETGWCSAKARNQSGILFVGTNALLAKVRKNPDGQWTIYVGDEKLWTSLRKLSDQK